MADRADVYVKNVFTDSINVIRRLPDGTGDLETVVASGNEEMVHLPETKVSLEINSPVEVDIKDHRIKVKSDVDLAVTHSRTDSNWTLSIVPNDLPADVPTTVNIEVGEVEPY